jgi:repressor LexA
VRGSSRGIRLLAQSRNALAHQFELPLIGRIAAGTPITAPENVDEHVTVDPNLFRPRADFLHRVDGHSMKDADILDGDLVGIHEQGEAENGAIIAAVISEKRTADDTITLKRYFRRGKTIVLKPESSDPRYKPIEVDLSQLDPETQERSPFRIAGIFVGLIRARR